LHARIGNMKESHRWTFGPRFRRHAFGWRSQPAITRIREAVTEIKKIARTNPSLGAEGAVLLIEKLSPALEQVDSSSGSIGAAVNHALEALAPIIGSALVEEETRSKWLDRLWTAIQDDDIPYIENLGEFWGDLCSTPECASYWADTLIGTVRLAWSPHPALRGYFKGTSLCFSALLKAGRNKEILELLRFSPHPFWDDRKWGVRALVAMGKTGEALQLAEACGDRNDSPYAIARECEQILLSGGMTEDAYSRFATEANQRGTFLAMFKAIVAKYPNKSPAQILHDLVESTPGEEGKWFVAAKSIGLYKEAIDLANRTPCDPRTLTRTARDMMDEEPLFALEAGMAALRWLAQGYGYEITGADVWSAYENTLKAAEKAACRADAIQRIKNLASGIMRQVLGRELGL
jgi:hypothetical protein